MSTTSRPPPAILIVHNGEPYQKHVKYLTDAGLRVETTNATSALSDAVRIQPDIVVLDFGCDGEITAQLKAHAATRQIPVIALVALMRES